MNTDELFALGIGMISALLLVPPIRHQVLELAGNPLGVLFGMISIVYALTHHYALTAMVLTAAVVYLMNARANYVSTTEQQIYLDAVDDDARFVASNSVDLQVANKTLVHDAPSMLNPPEPTPTLLAYPPSDDTLRSMSG